jgi:hypothetical protein
MLRVFTQIRSTSRLLQSPVLSKFYCRLVSYSIVGAVDNPVAALITQQQQLTEDHEGALNVYYDDV